MAFIGTGALGFIWVVFWMALYKKPQGHPAMSAAELRHIESDPPDKAEFVAWGSLLDKRETWAYGIGKFLTDPVWWFYLFWLPKYLVEQRGFTMVEMVVALGIASGLRRGELLALRWSDVDEAAGTLTVARSLSRAPGAGYAIAEPKSRRAHRTIALPVLAIDALRRQAEMQDREREAAGSAWQDRAGYVFADPIGRLLHPESVTSAWRALVARTGIGHLRLHDLRHTAATLSLSAGIPVQDVADMLGHSSASITLDVYSHAVAEAPRRVADAMDRALGGTA